MEPLWIVVSLVTLMIGVGFGWLLRGRSGPSSQTVARLAGAEARAAALQTQLQQQEALLRDTQAQARADQEHQRERERRDAAILTALSPVQESLANMRRSVATMERDRQEQFGLLTEQLRRAQESDESLRSATESLAGALRSNSARGTWGEAQLRRIVEATGLTRHIDFDEQVTIASGESSGRPDMIVRLPGSKAIAVDAKAPLDAFLRASAVDADATAMREHARAVRTHITALAKRSYWSGLEASPEFVICFLPSEAMLSAALEADATLLDYAFAQRVALASPISLFAVLKTVAFTWTQENVSAQAQELFVLGNQLFERLATLAKHADDVRGGLERAIGAYNRFAGSLESRVLVTARQFPGIDATRVAALTEPALITERPRTLNAPELSAPELSPAEISAAEIGELRNRLAP